MLCTNSSELLNSTNGRSLFGFRPPKGLPPYDPKQKNLIITWDIFMMDYRCVNMDECYLVRSYPMNTTTKRIKKGESIPDNFNGGYIVADQSEVISNNDYFWKYIFNKMMLTMKPIEKAVWMDS
jgi:hypothetical protein